MTPFLAIRAAIWFFSTVLTVAVAVSGYAQTRPITIPPATQITPPAVPGPAPPSPAPTPPPAMLGSIAPAPRTLLPAGVETVRDPSGAGIVMYGPLSGKADSALAVISAIFAYSGAFDPVPVPLLAVADKNDRSAQALFAATVQGATVLGVAVVTLSETGGNVSVFYDYANSFAAAFPRLQQALGPGRAETGLTQLHLVDGSDISIAPGWRVLGQGQGLVDLAGGQGEFITLGEIIPAYSSPTALAGSAAQAPCCDPSAALQAVFPQIAAGAQRRGTPPLVLTDIVDAVTIPGQNGGQAALILATVSVDGRPYSYLALTEAIGGFVDPWTLRLSSVMAPQPLFAAELPSLIAMWTSYSANPPGFGERLKAAAPSVAALQPMLQVASDATQYRADGGWNDVIKAAVTHPGATGSNPVDDATTRNLLDRLAKDSGGPWHVLAGQPH